MPDAANREGAGEGRRKTHRELGEVGADGGEEGGGEALAAVEGDLGGEEGGDNPADEGGGADKGDVQGVGSAIRDLE
eukprot:1684420-Rhodomonas_salina.2